MTEMEIHISVRGLVEFILRSGDIDNRHTVSSDNAMAEGGRIHRMIQRRMDSNYKAEVSLRYIHKTSEYAILIEGRADGVITEWEHPTALVDKEVEESIVAKQVVTIDEIKGTYRDIHKMKAPVPVHLAQAKCYAYIYAMQNGLEEIRVRMTYCNIDTEEIVYFHEAYTFVELREWFEEILEQYMKWADFEFAWKQKRQESIKQLAFPFPYRQGQKQLVTYVYQTIYHRKKLFIEAPTGVGKTISTVFPSVKAIGEERADKIFYLTAKTIARTVAADAFALLRKNGLAFKTVILTAKEKICFMDKTECNPEQCPYAKGHFDRINDAIYDLLIAEDDYSREVIEEYAKKHQVCPFEMCLDMSLFADAVICDYNYVFDPHAYLRRFFAEGVSGNYIFLIDEAHNLLDRGREMYSAILCKEDFLKLKKTVKEVSRKIEKNLDKCNKELLALKRECENYKIVESITPFILALNRLHSSMNQYLEEHDGKNDIRVNDVNVREEILEFYFEISHFLDIYDRLDDNYVMYTEMESDGSFILKLFCVNPSVNLKDCMIKAVSSILFSATLLPIQYYKKLLGGEEMDYEVYAESTFNPAKKALFIGSDVTSRYTRRTDMEFYNIGSYIHEIVKNRHGNYMVFFPSYTFMHQVYHVYEQYFMTENVECLQQSEHMSETEREYFLNRFEGNEACDITLPVAMEIEFEEEDRSLVGFCVVGGIFSEGIDLKHDRLIGAIIVGTGIPQVCNEREILKNFFDGQGDNGFDYAYRYPGMNKVLQSAGRVIRTAEDVGIVALLDDRFLQPAYQKMFPREWDNYEVVTTDRIARRVERFWDEWL
ncbi:MAG: ATP-dependent DNA helicase [Lachnospiraceae bacterium]|nr:ATP-dependent DNA helicase [Lachnospiraceae bacterium]